MELQQVRKDTAVTIRQQGKTFSLNDSRLNLETLRNDERKIITARKTGYALCDLSEKEYDFALSGIIFTVSVICGCQLPTHDAHVNALEKEFSVFLKEYDYSHMTTEEVLTAFRMNSNGMLENRVEIYGSIFNIDYAGKVLSQYRSKSGRLEMKLANKIISIEYDEQIAAEDQARRVKIKEQWENYKQDNTAELDLSNCYMQLLHDGAFADKNLYFRFTNKAEALIRSRGIDAPISELINRYQNNLDISFEAQSLAVKYLFEQMAKTDKRIVYTDDWKIAYPGFEVPGDHMLIDIDPNIPVEDLPF
jgi:hypothetical protein